MEILQDITYKDLFYAGSEEEYRTAIDTAREHVTTFLQRTKKPFSGITPAALLA